MKRKPGRTPQRERTLMQHPHCRSESGYGADDVYDTLFRTARRGNRSWQDRDLQHCMSCGTDYFHFCRLPHDSDRMARGQPIENRPQNAANTFEAFCKSSCEKISTVDFHMQIIFYTLDSRKIYVIGLSLTLGFSVNMLPGSYTENQQIYGTGKVPCLKAALKGWATLSDHYFR